MTFRFAPARRVPLLLLGLLALPACDRDPVDVLDTPEILFFTQSQAPSATLDAFFSGEVGPDGEGCLRQDGSGATVLWPAGFRVQEEGGQLVVLDARGEPVGRIGFAFSLTGGQVSVLDESSGLSESTRGVAASRCPGTYWIVDEAR